MSLLHQAAYWGRQGAVETLLGEFKADPKELTSDDVPITAADVADAEGHAAVAKFLRDRIMAPATAPTAADIALAHELLSQARDDGGDDVVWTEILEKLKERPLAAARPAKRKYSLLHQAAYWGKQSVVETLLNDFKADLKELTADDEAQDAAAVAESQGHDALATWLREHDGAAAVPAPAPVVPAPVAPAPAAAAACDDEGADAPSPYDSGAAAGNKLNSLAGVESAIRVWLCLRPDGAASRWQLYSRVEQRQIEAAHSAAHSVALVGGRSLRFADSEESGPGGERRKVASFLVLWEWDGGDGGKAAADWKAYPPEAQWALEAAMCGKDATAEVTVAPGKSYVVDLVGFRQYSSKDTFRCRRVRRRGVALREPFPAKVRDTSSGTWLDLSHLPDYWLEACPGLTIDKPARFDLPVDSPIFNRISDWMNSTIRTGHAAAYGQVPGHGGPTKAMEVIRVEVVSQPLLWRRYCCYKGQLQSKVAAIKAHEGTKYLAKNPSAMPKCEWLDSDVGEAYFWHGSGKSADGSVDLVEAIVSVGHEPSDENSEVMEVSDGASSRFAKTTSMFGAGVYLADIASKANLYVPCPKCHQGAYFRDPCHCSMAEVEKCEPYRMLLCRAAMGRMYVERKYKEDRYKGEFNPARKLGVDSVMGEAVKGQLAFREYVVYHDSASYPEFIVHYRRRAHPWKGGGGPKKKAKKG